MAADVGLVVNAVLLRIQTCGNIESQKISGSSSQLGRILAHCDGVHIHHAEKGLILVAYSNPVLQRSQIISKSQVSCCLHTAEKCFLSV